MSSSNNHISVGNDGERMAEEFLINKGYIILERNYRYKRSEIDIIASKESVLVFVEVKTRKSSLFGLPEESVNIQKTHRVLSAAEHYVHETAWEKEIRFDIIAITVGKKIELIHIEDAFY